MNVRNSGLHCPMNWYIVHSSNTPRVLSMTCNLWRLLWLGSEIIPLNCFFFAINISPIWPCFYTSFTIRKEMPCNGKSVKWTIKSIKIVVVVVVTKTMRAFNAHVKIFLSIITDHTSQNIKVYIIFLPHCPTYISEYLANLKKPGCQLFIINQSMLGQRRR